MYLCIYGYNIRIQQHIACLRSLPAPAGGFTAASPFCASSDNRDFHRDTCRPKPEPWRVSGCFLHGSLLQAGAISLPEERLPYPHFYYDFRSSKFRRTLASMLRRIWLARKSLEPWSGFGGLLLVVSVTVSLSSTCCRRCSSQLPDPPSSEAPHPNAFQSCVTSFHDTNQWKLSLRRR